MHRTNQAVLAPCPHGTVAYIADALNFRDPETVNRNLRLDSNDVEPRNPKPQNLNPKPLTPTGAHAHKPFIVKIHAFPSPILHEVISHVVKHWKVGGGVFLWPTLSLNP